MRTSPKHITELAPNEVFVFGSNLSGIHGGGAARTALQWGAVWGQAEGMQGQTYAIPTKSEGFARTLSLAEIRPYVGRFIEYARKHHGLRFMVTEIGCGIAGLTPAEVAPLFEEAKEVTNIYLPESFINILEP